MSMTDQNPTHRSDTDPRGRRPETFRRTMLRETKPSQKTTELWLTIIGVGLLTVVYNASHDASLNLFRACLLGTVMGSAYIVSRGFAKAGSHEHNVGEYERS